jgi:hypothetical protein
MEKRQCGCDSPVPVKTHFLQQDERYGIILPLFSATLSFPAEPSERLRGEGKLADRK